VNKAEELVLFRAGGARYALGIREVREIKKVPGYTLVRHAPAFVLGVINLRGRIVTLVDLSRLLGGSAAAPAFPLTVLFALDGEELVGLAVDEVDDTVLAPSEALFPLPGNVPPARRKVSRALYQRDGEIVTWLDCGALLAQESR
jgi:purine-binding chemotaxis protein CheW